MQQRKALKMQPRCTQQPDYTAPRLPEIYRKPLSWGHLAITDEMLVPKGVHYRGVPLYFAMETCTESMYEVVDHHENGGWLLMFNRKEMEMRGTELAAAPFSSPSLETV